MNSFFPKPLKLCTGYNQYFEHDRDTFWFTIWIDSQTVLSVLKLPNGEIFFKQCTGIVFVWHAEIIFDSFEHLSREMKHIYANVVRFWQVWQYYLV